MNRVLHYFKNIKLNPLVNKTNFEKGKKKYSGKNAGPKTTIRQFSTYNKQTPPPPGDPLWFIVIVASSCELLNIIKNNK
jgi:hypothetical protein